MGLVVRDLTGTFGFARRGCGCLPRSTGPWLSQYFLALSQVACVLKLQTLQSILAERK